MKIIGVEGEKHELILIHQMGTFAVRPGKFDCVRRRDVVPGAAEHPGFLPQPLCLDF